MSDPESIAMDALEDEYYSQIGSEYAAEHADEIADEFERAGVFGAMLAAHDSTWRAVKPSRDLARARVATANWNEAVFHGARFFERYIQDVFVKPIRARLIERFQEALPGINTGDNDVLKRITGLGGAEHFALYAISAAIGEHTTASRVLSEFKDFMKRSASMGGWSLRNQVAHGAVDANGSMAEPFVATTGGIIAEIAFPFVREGLTGILEPNRVALLGELAKRRSTPGMVSAKGVLEYARRGMSQVPATALVHTLAKNGYIKQDGARYNDAYVSITALGFEHWQNDIVPALEIAKAQ